MIIGGKPPSELHKWDDTTHEWKICPELVEQKRLQDVAERLEKLHKEREEQNYKGVEVDGVLYPTDTLSRTKYAECINLLVLGVYVNNTKIDTAQGEVVLTGGTVKGNQYRNL